MGDWRKAVSFRNRAEELRTMADDLKSDEHRRVLNRIADDYDQLAGKIEAAVTVLPL